MIEPLISDEILSYHADPEPGGEEVSGFEKAFSLSFITVGSFTIYVVGITRLYSSTPNERYSVLAQWTLTFC